MDPKININTASVRELARAKGIGQKSAEKIVKARETKGPFESVVELYDLNISKGILDVFLRDRDVSVGDDVHEDVSLSRRITLKNPKDSQCCFKEYVIHVSFTVLRTDEQGNVRYDPVLRSLSVVENNSAVFGYDPQEEFGQELTIIVRAPNGEILRRLERTPSDFLNADTLIEVCPSTAILSPATTVNPFNEKLKGRVIDLNGKAPLDDTQVILFASKVADPEEGDFAAISVAVTESEGYFAMGHPGETWSAAYAFIGVKGGKQVPVRLEDASEAGGTLPKHLLLVVEPGAELPSPCDEDGCRDLQFKAAKQALEEFPYQTVVRTTEPEIQASVVEEEERVVLSEPVTGMWQRYVALSPNQKTAGAAAGSSEDTLAMKKSEPSTNEEAPDVSGQIKVRKSVLSRFLNLYGSLSQNNAGSLLEMERDASLNDLAKTGPRLPKMGRVLLGADHAVDWDDEPTIYQAVSVSHGHLLYFKQEWIADGYSLGDLLYSLPLAPGQKKQIVVFDWERRESAANMQSLDYQESLHNALSRDRDINEIAKGSVQEHVSAGSESTTWGFGGGIGAWATNGAVGVLAGFAGGRAGSEASSWQNASRQAASSSMQRLRDRTVQSSNALRSQRSTVIQSVSQGERFEVQSESVANYNHAHALTIQYFEVLRHFKVQHRLADVRECLFVPLMMSLFERDKALRWREILSPFLLNRRLRKGFAAMERIKNHYEGSNLPEGSYAAEEVTHLEGEFKIRFLLTRPQDDDEGAFLDVNWHWLRWLFGMSGQQFHRLYLEREERRDEIFLERIGAKVASKISASLGLSAVLNSNSSAVPLNTDFTLVSGFENDRPLTVTVRFGGNLPSMKREDISSLVLSDKIHGYDDLATGGESGVPGVGEGDAVPISALLPAGSRIVVESGWMRYRTGHSTGYLFRNGRIRDDLHDGVGIATPTTSRELRDPRKEDLELAANLRDHLNDNLEYYHRAIWMNMDSERRFLLLDGIIAPGCKANGRSVASVVENKVIGIVGNCLVLPVAPGFQLDPTYEPEMVNAETGEVVSLMAYYNPEPMDPICVSVPTKGVFAEAVLGRCNSCEKIEEDRYWRWNEAPIPDSPTDIQPIATDSRRTDPPSGDAKDFPAPMINLQNAPAAPDPTGLGAVLELLSKPEVFRDMTGLSQTQQNALAAFQQTMKSAEAFGKNSLGLTSLAGQMQMSEKGTDKAISRIQKALQQDLISEEEAGQLTKRALESGMPDAPEKAPDSITRSPEIREAIGHASESPSSEIDVSGADGETVSIRGGGLQSFDIRYDVPLIPQMSTLTCWAAGAAMLVAWRENMSVDPNEVADAAGYWAQYNIPLSPQDTHMFQVWGLSPEPAQTYTIEAFKNLVEAYGPLWVASAEPSPHIRVVTGISGDGTPSGTTVYVNDPEPVGTGSRHTETFQQFEAKQRSLAATELTVQGIYVAHL